MTDSFAPVTPPTAAPLPPVVAPVKKQDRTFTILLGVALVIAVGGVAFAVGRVTAPAAAPTTASRFAGGGFGAGGTGTAGAGTGGFARGGFGGVLLTGTVSSISGNTMTLTEANGATVNVDLTGTTTYHSQAAATASRRDGREQGAGPAAARGRLRRWHRRGRWLCRRCSRWRHRRGGRWCDRRRDWNDRRGDRRRWHHQDDHGRGRHARRSVTSSIAH